MEGQPEEAGWDGRKSFCFWPLQNSSQKSIASTARGDDANPDDNAPERSDSEHGDGPEPLADDHGEDDSEQSDHADQGDDDAADGDSKRDAGQGVLGSNLNRVVFLKFHSQPIFLKGVWMFG